MDDRGSISLEFTLVFAALLTLILVVFQVAVYQHAQHVALAAAQEGARTARAHAGTVASGQASAQSYLDALAPNLITGKKVTVTRTATLASVRVTGAVQPVLPFFAWTVDEQASGPVERFVVAP